MPRPLDLLILLSFLTASPVITARPPPNPSPILPLASRLKLDGGSGGEEGSTKCWDSLFQLQSCNGEVVLFFLNGETYLGPSCCAAIQTIESQCWPTMLGSLGFTAEEGGILRGYCEAADNDSKPPSPPHAVGTTGVKQASHVYSRP